MDYPTGHLASLSCYSISFLVSFFFRVFWTESKSHLSGKEKKGQNTNLPAKCQGAGGKGVVGEKELAKLAFALYHIGTTRPDSRHGRHVAVL